MINKNLTIENAKIGKRNFAGKELKYNPPGRRNFLVFLDTNVAEELSKDGWNIRWLQPKDPEEDKQACLQVTVSYSNMPPKIIVITTKNKTVLDEASVKMLDWAEIESIDLIIRPYNWEVNGKRGVKAYVKSMYVTLVEDAFESKYRDVPDSAASEDETPPWD